MFDFIAFEFNRIGAKHGKIDVPLELEAMKIVELNLALTTKDRPLPHEEILFVLESDLHEKRGAFRGVQFCLYTPRIVLR